MKKFFVLIIVFVLVFFCNCSQPTNQSSEVSSVPKGSSDISISSYEIGDIICYDGSIIRAKNNVYSIPEGTKCLAIIFQVSNGGKTGIGVGLFEETKKWAVENSIGWKTSFPTSQTDGSINWSIICAKDPSGSGSAQKNYPAFYWANTYGISYCSTSLYSTNWYIPSEIELNTLYVNRTAVNLALNAAHGTILTDKGYWSSCQYTAVSSQWYHAIYYNYLYGTADYSTKYNLKYVRTVHYFSF